MPMNENAATPRPTPLVERWRGECQRALARADPDGADDPLVALIVGAYFHAIHAALSVIADPQAQDHLCEEEAVRFLGMLRGVPDRRRRLFAERTDALRRDGLVVFPHPPGAGDTP